MNLLVTVSDWTSRARIAKYRSRDLARLCGVSPGYLRQFFVGRFHRPPQEWLDELRMWEAFRMLCQGVSVKECAFTLGFKQVSHFSRAFIRYHGFCASRCAEINQSCERARRRQLEARFGESCGVDSMLPAPFWIDAERALSLNAHRKSSHDGIRGIAMQIGAKSSREITNLCER